MTFVPLAVVERDGAVESIHHGAYVALNGDGTVVASAGSPDVRVFGRSAWKPVQAAAMVACGLDVPDELLAVVAASHSGSPQHLQGVHSLLERAGVGEEMLANTPDLPFDVDEARRVLAAGGGPTALTANCSGKHAGMLVTCARNDWPMADGAYLDGAHPLQREIWALVRRLAGIGAAQRGADGCRAPTFACTLLALAQTFRRVATAAHGSPEHAVYRAMTSHPTLSAGSGRVATDVMLAVPGMLGKDGAEGVFAAAHADGRALALKISDGSPRAWRPILAGILRGLGFAVDPFDHDGVLTRGASGYPLSRVRAL